MEKKIEKLLFKMFTENTGTHILDSGGIYGRHFERNGKLTFSQAKKLPEIKHEIYVPKDGKAELIVTINVFKYLLKADLIADEICARFNRLNGNAKDWDNENFYGVSFKAGEFLESFQPEVLGDCWNTYNDSCSLLSQVLQGYYLNINGEKYILLQIHNGCDVRGGYTDARLFKFGEHSEGYLPSQDISGIIDGVEVDNLNNGYSFTDSEGNSVDIRADSKVELWLL